MPGDNAIQQFSNVIGFDDAPFPADYVGMVKIVGTVYARQRLNGVLIGEITKDGNDAAEKLVELVARSRFAQNIQLIMLQGITLAGFNVVNVLYAHAQLGLPILLVARKQPDMEAIRRALNHIPDGQQKWGWIEQLGPMESVAQVYVQRVGLTLAQAAAVVKQYAVEGWIPEPLRVAHLIAGAVAEGHSRGRA